MGGLLEMTAAAEHLSSVSHPGVLIHLSRFNELRTQFQARRAHAGASIAKFVRSQRTRHEFATEYAHMIESFMDGEDCDWRILVYCTDRVPNRAVFFANDTSPEAEVIVTRFPNAAEEDVILCVSTQHLDALSKMSHTSQLVEAAGDFALILSIIQPLTLTTDFDFNAIVTRALYQGVALSGSACAGRFLTFSGPKGAADHFETAVAMLLSEYLQTKGCDRASLSDEGQVQDLMLRFGEHAALLMSLDDVFRDDVGIIAHGSAISGIVAIAEEIVSGVAVPRPARLREAA